MLPFEDLSPGSLDVGAYPILLRFDPYAHGLCLVHRWHVFAYVGVPECRARCGPRPDFHSARVATVLILAG